MCHKYIYKFVQKYIFAYNIYLCIIICINESFKITLTHNDARSIHLVISDHATSALDSSSDLFLDISSSRSLLSVSTNFNFNSNNPYSDADSNPPAESTGSWGVTWAVKYIQLIEMITV